jgi:hypothetical protein
LKNTRARSGSKTQLDEVGTRRRTRRGLKKLDDEEGVLHPSIHPSMHHYHRLLQGACSVSYFWEISPNGDLFFKLANFLYLKK